MGYFTNERGDNRYSLHNEPDLLRRLVSWTRQNLCREVRRKRNKFAGYKAVLTAIPGSTQGRAFEKRC